MRLEFLRLECSRFHHRSAVRGQSVPRGVGDELARVEVMPEQAAVEAGVDVKRCCFNSVTPQPQPTLGPRSIDAA